MHPKMIWFTLYMSQKLLRMENAMCRMNDDKERQRETQSERGVISEYIPPIYASIQRNCEDPRLHETMAGNWPQRMLQALSVTVTPLTGDTAYSDSFDSFQMAIHT